MARARNIKPSFFKNEELAECSVWARLLFIGLWTLADRDGRLEYRPLRIKAELFPYDAVEIPELAVELHGKKLLVRYAVGGKQYLHIPNFVKHQRPHPKEPDSVFPEPPEAVSTYVKAVEKHGEPGKETASCAFPSLNLNPLNLNASNLNPSNLNEEPPTPDLSGKPDRAAAIREVIAHYQTYHPKAKVPGSDSGEWKKITARLREGYSVDDLKRAIDGCHLSRFHSGENDRNMKYQRLDLIVRDSGKVTEFMEIADNPKQPIVSEKTSRTMETIRRRAAQRGDSPNGD
jgi:hypothetical protein